MNVDRSPMWIGLADLLFCILSAMIVAVASTKATVDGLKPKAEFRITADWPVALDSDDVDLWLVGPEKEACLLWGARGRVRVARSRQPRLFDIADHARRQVYGAVGIEQGNGDHSVHRTRPL
jgi:hypothetical protein